jgi:hypothetical protein
VDLVVATETSIDLRELSRLLPGLRDLDVSPLLDHAPVHWARVRSPTAASHADVAGLLSRGGVPIRYVASARKSAMTLPPALDFDGAVRAKALDWSCRTPSSTTEPPSERGRWFLGPSGTSLDRAVCGTGAGVRVAVVDDDAADADRLQLDRVIPVGVDRISSASGHGGLMVGWTVGALRSDGTRFLGVAPDASARLYCIPKPGEDVVSLPLAIVRATLDGADVILCATYLEATTSPMLDDALEVATFLGRRGRGAAVVLPTGRETSSAGGSVHASLSLAFGDPASDPHVHCVAPSGRAGGWFLWRDPRGKLRPFANRGPAVRWLAPGDDLAYPFGAQDRLFHAESSGAAAVAAGVLALVLGCNPSLRASELHALLERTTDAPDAARVPDAALADPADILPAGRDRDGHDAKCGYGRLNATRACAAARDPFALALALMGEDELAAGWCTREELPYSPALARWTVRMLLARADLLHAVRVVMRHARLVAAAPSRVRAHAPGALARQLGLVARELAREAPPTVRAELERAVDGLRRASSGVGPFGAALDQGAANVFEELWRERA